MRHPRRQNRERIRANLHAGVAVDGYVITVLTALRIRVCTKSSDRFEMKVSRFVSVEFSLNHPTVSCAAAMSSEIHLLDFLSSNCKGEAYRTVALANLASGVF